jgi:hypothetical protein
MYENRTMKHVDIVLRREEEGIKEKDRGDESNRIYCIYFYKCHGVSPYNYNMPI